MIPQKRMECFRLLFDYLAWIKHEFLSGIRDSRSHRVCEDVERCGRSKEVNTPEFIGQRVRLGLLCWGFKGVQEEIPSQEANTLQIGSVAFPRGQCTSPQLILVTDYLTKIGIKTVPQPPIDETLLPVTFSYSLSSEAVVMRQLRRWKRLWRRS